MKSMISSSESSKIILSINLPPSQGSIEPEKHSSIDLDPSPLSAIVHRTDLFYFVDVSSLLYEASSIQFTIPKTWFRNPAYLVPLGASQEVSINLSLFEYDKAAPTLSTISISSLHELPTFAKNN
mmetsp:Transcript_21367/g.33054  ORF Transcript_21367/g.33054 Transcript_21367/m.33054 type:complete len:125 (+) Transcript_21367:6383-6757(+)